MQDAANTKKIGLGSNPLLRLFAGAAPAPVPPPPAAPAAPEPPALESGEGKGGAVAAAAPPRPAPAGRNRRRPRLPSASPEDPEALHRTERVTVWLTPEERERLRLLALAEDLTDSSIGRQAVLAHLSRYARLVEQARVFRAGLLGPA